MTKRVKKGDDPDLMKEVGNIFLRIKLAPIIQLLAEFELLKADYSGTKFKRLVTNPLFSLNIMLVFRDLKLSGVVDYDKFVLGILPTFDEYGIDLEKILYGEFGMDLAVVNKEDH